jgi:TonB family protein
MMLHCFESGRTTLRHRAGMPALWSVGAHGALALSIMVSAALPDEREAGRDMREVVFLLPLLPKAPVAGGAGMGAPLPFVGPGRGAPAERTGDAPPAGGEREPGRSARSEEQQATAAALPDSVFSAGSFVYTEAELDQPVERDPGSAGPTYPESLRQVGIEGEVTAEWIVDTVGTADSTSFRLVSSSHQLFTEAVRTVLPQMRFRPATLDGRHVRQFVRQQFRFQLQQPVASAQQDSTAG